jgi:hypothetical protein
MNLQLPMPATAATMESAAPKARASARRIPPCLSAPTVAAEGTRADAGLAAAAGCSVSSSSWGVSAEAPSRCTGTIVNSTAPANAPLVRPVPTVGVVANSAAYVGSYATLASPR